MAGGYQKARHQQLQRVPPDSDPESEVTRKVGFGRFVLLSCLALPCVLAMSQQPMLRCAQAREGEAQEL